MGKDTTTLVTQVLNVINAALEKHGDSLPYKPLLAASEKVLGDQPIGIAVYESDPANPFDWFTVRFRERSFELASHGKADDVDLAWKVSREYLQQVAEDAQTYIDNPARLDWDWLKSRVGV